MKRKVSQIGPSTLMVSLPSRWAKMNGISKGDELELIEDGNRLLIGGTGTQPMKKTEIDVTGLYPMIKRAIGALYKSGYDEFKIDFDTIEELKDARFVIRDEFIGFEVTEQSKNSITAKQISSIQSDELDIMMRRMFIIIKTMAEDTYSAIKENDNDQMQEIILRDLDVNKISDFCRRLINKNSMKMEKAPPLYFIAEQLEKVGDCYRDICKNHLNREKKVNDITIEMIKKVNVIYALFYESYSDFSLKRMAVLGKERKNLQKEFLELFCKDKVDDLHIILPLNKAFEATFDMNGPLMALKL